MHIDLHLPTNRCPWQINTPPPRDRFFEIMHMGTRLIAVYQPREECWTVGTDFRIEREEITHWRDLTEQQLDHLNEQLAQR